MDVKCFKIFWTWWGKGGLANEDSYLMDEESQPQQETYRITIPELRFFKKKSWCAAAAQKEDTFQKSLWMCLSRGK